MCIRDSLHLVRRRALLGGDVHALEIPERGDSSLRLLELGLVEQLSLFHLCLLYTSDAADERSSVDLGGRRIIKKKKKNEHRYTEITRDENITITRTETTQYNINTH